MKEFAELKEIISEKVEELENRTREIQKELEVYKRILIKIDSILEKESFTTAADLYKAEAEIPEESIEISEPNETERNEIELKASDETVIGKMIVEKNVITIIPDQKIRVLEDSPPFKNFFRKNFKGNGR